VTIEVDEEVLYTSEEDNGLTEEVDNDNDSIVDPKAIKNSQAKLKQSLNQKRGKMGSGGSNRVSTISGLSGQKREKERRVGGTVNVSSQ
jgi:hypothetical protein